MRNRNQDGVSVLGFAAVIAFASYRVWAFIALDSITEPIRKKVIGGTRGRAREYVKLWWMCPWCAGSWITLAVTFLVRKRIPAPLLVGVAAAAGTALLGGNDDRLMAAESDLD